MSVKTQLHVSFLCFLIVIAAVLQPVAVFSQSDNCKYDSSKPLIDQLEPQYSTWNYHCTEQILLDLLNSKPSVSVRAQAHGWLALTYSEMYKDSLEAYNKALEQFLMALKDYPGYYPPEKIESNTRAARAYRDAVYSLQRENLSLCEQYQEAVKRGKRLRLATGLALVGAAVTAFVVNSSADNAYDRYESAVSPADISSEWDSYESKYHARNIVIGIGGALAITEFLLLLHKPKKPELDCEELLKNADKPRIGFTTDGSGVRLTFWFSGL